MDALSPELSGQASGYARRETSMKALHDLARFVRAKDTDEEREEIRDYASMHLAELADAFDLEAAVLQALIESVGDARLAAVLLSKTKQASIERRHRKAADRLTAAQTSADILGSVAEWHGDGAHLDVVSLLAGSLSARSDMLVFICRTFVVSIPMAPLFNA